MILFVVTYAILYSISASYINFDNNSSRNQRRDYMTSYERTQNEYNVKVARFYFIQLPLGAAIPSLIFLLSVLLANKKYKKKNDEFVQEDVFVPFPFSEISSNGVLGISLGDTYPEVTIKLHELNMISDKWREDALAIYKEYPDVTIHTDKMNNPYMGVKNLTFSFIKYKLEVICIYLSDSNKTKEKYDELKELFTIMLKDIPAVNNETIYWKYDNSILAINTEKGVISIQITK